MFEALLPVHLTYSRRNIQTILFYFAIQGKITSEGQFDELSQSGVDFSELLKRSEQEVEHPKIVSQISHVSDQFEYGSRVSLQSTLDEYMVRK